MFQLIGSRIFPSSAPVWHTSVGSNKEPLPPPHPTPPRASSGSASSQHERTPPISPVAARLPTVLSWSAGLSKWRSIVSKTHRSANEARCNNTETTKKDAWGPIQAAFSVPSLFSAGTCTDYTVPSWPSQLNVDGLIRVILASPLNQNKCGEKRRGGGAKKLSNYKYMYTRPALWRHMNYIYSNSPR